MDAPSVGEYWTRRVYPDCCKEQSIIKIGYWVLQQACWQLKAWEISSELNKIRHSVNISAQQFLYINFTQELRHIITVTGTSPDLLKLELTETAVRDSFEDVISKIDVLKELGIKIALDDFGMGHSALVCFKMLPVTKIKIDRSFVSNAAIIQMILAIGRTINVILWLRAEG